MAYLKKVPDAKKDSGVGNGWFKIQEGGYTNGKWATNVVIENKGNQVINIPPCIENGQYLLRAEMVALHGARSTNGAQLYVRSFCKLLRLKKRRLTTDFRWSVPKSKSLAGREQPRPRHTASPGFTRQVFS